jgi:light-regulated signal transduction histidine kinase (bacteriophytochrome)
LVRSNLLAAMARYRATHHVRGTTQFPQQVPAKHEHSARFHPAEQVFRAFYTTRAEGAGMGLTIGRYIMVSHGGRRWVTANSGWGATFHFTVPSETWGLE